MRIEYNEKTMTFDVYDSDDLLDGSFMSEDVARDYIALYGEWDWESERTCSYPCAECGESWEDEDDSDE